MIDLKDKCNNCNHEKWEHSKDGFCNCYLCECKIFNKKLNEVKE